MRFILRLLYIFAIFLALVMLFKCLVISSSWGQVVEPTMELTSTLVMQKIIYASVHSVLEPLDPMERDVRKHLLARSISRVLIKIPRNLQMDLDLTAMVLKTNVYWETIDYDEFIATAGLIEEIRININSYIEENRKNRYSSFPTHALVLMILDNIKRY